jgi:RimJ/RimL family protein N-acetyltransferase
VVDIARYGLRLKRLRAGHFIDNPASGRVLSKLGFRHSGTALRYSAGRAAETPCKLFELDLQSEAEEADPCAMAA